MTFLTFLCLSLLSMAVAINFTEDEKAGTEDEKAVIVTKAASSDVNCGCQCSSLTFRDEYDQVHGNCKRVDDKGAQWCYVSSTHYSSCQDLQPSTKFPHNPWSYTACATPEVSSYECQFLATPTSGYAGAGASCHCTPCITEPRDPAGADETIVFRK